jgi:uncharacterized membrane protein
MSEPSVPAADVRGRGPRGGRRPLAAALGLSAALFIALSPWPLDAKLRLVGYACCAQAPTRTIRIGGHLMPLDARDAGIYLALLLGIAMAVAVGRGRSGRWPCRPVAALLGGLFVAMVVDGINSSFQTRGLHGLYHTTNALRIVTGAGAGLALAVLGLPLVNRIVWQRPEDEAVAADYGELAGFAVGTAVLVAVLLAPPARLYYPLSVLAVLGVVAGWGLVNGVIVAVATRSENRAITLADGGVLWLAGIVLSLCEIGIIDVVRSATSR